MTAFRNPSDGDDVIRRALAAVAEQRRISRLRAQRAADLEVARARVDVCTAALAVEERDEARARDGAWARVAGVFFNRTQRIADETREASDAAARLVEAQATVALLAGEVAEIDRQLTALAGADAALHAARQAKLEALLAMDDPAAAELLAIVSALADANAEVQRLDARLTAGAHVEEAVTTLRGLLAAASTALRDETERGDSRARTEERLAAARAQVETVQAAVSELQRELAAIDVALDAPFLAVDSLLPTGWLSELLTNRRAAGLDAAHTATGHLDDEVGRVLFALRERRHAAAQHRDDLRAPQRDACLAPPDLGV